MENRKLKLISQSSKHQENSPEDYLARIDKFEQVLSICLHSYFEKLRCEFKTLTQNNPPQPLMDIKELSEMLRIGKGQIYLMVRKSRIPAIRIGKFLRFDRDKIEKWLKDKSLS